MRSTFFASVINALLSETANLTDICNRLAALQHLSRFVPQSRPAKLGASTMKGAVTWTLP
jgi:hypothetical protein